MNRTKEDQILALFEYLVENPEGVTVDQMGEHLGVSLPYVNILIQGLRDVLGDGDSINLPCDVDPKNPTGRRIYHLEGTVEKMQAWFSTRIGDAERRVKTMHQMSVSAAAGTDGRTMEGKKARVIKKNLGRLLEDLDDLVEADAP